MTPFSPALEREIRDALPMVRAVVVATPNGVLWESYVEGEERDVIWHGKSDEELPLGPAYAIEATPEQLHHVKSVTKSVLSLLVGIALDRGVLGSLDQTVGDLLPRAASRSDKAAIRVADLLAMRSGLEWEENGPITFDYVRSGDTLSFTLERQQVLHPPGAVAEYSTADSHLLGCCLAAAASAPLDELARSWLFEPLGIANYKWLRDGTGAVIGGSELFLRPRDMATIGLLVLQRGRWGDDVLVSSQWLDYVTTTQSDLDLRAWAKGKPLSPYRTGYAHHWWRGAIGGYDVPFAHGLGGQTIQVYADLDAVVVTTTDSHRDAEADPVLDVSVYLADRWIVPAIEEALATREA